MQIQMGFPSNVIFFIKTTIFPQVVSIKKKKKRIPWWPSS